MNLVEPTDRTRVRRLPKRAVYDREQIYSILDEAFLCHLGFVVDGQPYVIPTAYARHGDLLYIHGSAASRAMRLRDESADVCLTVTLLDGFVLARSAFHHSMNYRSVVVVGKVRPVTNYDEKWTALRVLTDHLVPGRSREVRPPTDQEMKGTGVLALPLEEASAKVRTGPPLDDEEDYELPIWAGVVPVSTAIGVPVPDARVMEGVAAFDASRFALRGKRSV
jgi:nitroimidazol reductase NimA-like FMN-containing flavoprotein (pyridoxamine 5'-phosphate oxidase superfamily)